MRRLCFIGDSHLACIKKAWDRELAARHPEASAIFFAVPGSNIEHLEVRDGALSAENPKLRQYLVLSSGGLDRIDGSYDAYALHGMYLGVATALGTLRAGKGRPYLERIASDGYRAQLRNAIENSVSITTLRKLRRITQAPAVLSPTAFTHGQMPWLRKRLVEMRAAEPLIALLDEELRRACRNLDAVFVPQPLETLGEDGLAAKPEYSASPVRYVTKLDEPLPEDRSHLNVHYGAEMTAAVMTALASF